MPTTVSDAIAAKNTTPLFRSRMMRVGPKGITIQSISPATATISGAVLKMATSAARGVMCSFCSSLTVSAMVCSRPWGPTCLGPSRDWIHPPILRSSSTPNMAPTTDRKVNIATASPMALAISRPQFTGEPPAGLRPFERALPPGVRQAEEEDDEEDQHLDERELPQPLEDDSPRVEIDDFHIEDHEDQTEKVVADVELRPGLAERHDAGLIGQALLRIRRPRRKGPDDGKRQRSHSQADDRKHSDVQPVKEQHEVWFC